MLPDERAIYEPRWKSQGKDQEGQKTLYTIVQYIHYAVRYALFGAQVADASAVNKLFQETISQLHPLKRLHKP